MYAYFKGTVTDISPENCIIEVNNIGYNIRISPSTASRLSLGSEAKIYTYTAVREDAISLIGFLSASDLNMFRQLITVNGIGPKGGLSILSVMDADSVRFAILSGDVNTLSKAPGVGKKSAERVILELRGKVDANEILLSEAPNTDNRSNTVLNKGNAKEAVEALTALGYNSTDALKAVNSLVITDDTDVEQILKMALKELY